MEVTAVDADTGALECLSVDEDCTLGQLLYRASDALGCSVNSVSLHVGAADLLQQHGASARLADCEGLEAGCYVVLRQTPEHYTTRLREGAMQWHDVPEWAQQRRDCAIAALTAAPTVFASLPREFREDKDIALLAVRSLVSNLQHAGPLLRDDPDVVAVALGVCASALQYAGPVHRSDPDLLLRMMRQGPGMQHAAPEMQCNKRFVMEALAVCRGRGLQHVSPELRNDREVVTVAVRRHAPSFEHASAALRGDKRFVLQVLRDANYIAHHQRLPRRFWWSCYIPCEYNEAWTCCLLRFASNELRADHTVVLTSVRLRGDALFHASPAMCADKRVVLEAVRRHNVFEHIHPSMRAESDIVLEALQRWSIPPALISPALLCRKRFVLKAVALSPSVYAVVPPELRSDQDVVMAALKRRPMLYASLPEGLRTRKASLAVLTANASLCGDVPPVLFSDRTFVLAAVSLSAVVLEKASAELRDDAKVVRASVHHCPNTLRYASPRLRSQAGVVRVAISRCASALEHASSELQRSKSIVMQAILQHPTALTYTAEDNPLRSDKTFALAAVRRSGQPVQGISPDIQSDPEMLALLDPSQPRSGFFVSFLKSLRWR